MLADWRKQTEGLYFMLNWMHQDGLSVILVELMISAGFKLTSLSVNVRKITSELFKPKLISWVGYY